MEELGMEYLHGGEGEVRTLGVLVVHLPVDGGWRMAKWGTLQTIYQYN